VQQQISVVVHLVPATPDAPATAQMQVLAADGTVYESWDPVPIAAAGTLEYSPVFVECQLEGIYSSTPAAAPAPAAKAPAAPAAAKPAAPAPHPGPKATGK
jgi:hypothetical protein